MTNARSPSLQVGAARAGAMPPAGFELRCAESRDDWEEVRALRYRALRRRGEIPESADGFPDDGLDARERELGEPPLGAAFERGLP